MTKPKKAKRVNYKCGWCGCEFTQDVIYVSDGKPLSTQVKCKCGNFLPTWKRESTGNVVGKKHIHLGRGI